MYNGTLPPPFISDVIIRLSNKAIEKYNGLIGKSYSFDEISKHNKKDDCWIIVNNKVYDITEYLLYHPGGPNLIFKRAGNDATDDFEGMFHSRNAKAILEKFYIGKALSGSSNNNNNLLTPNYKPAPSMLNKNSPFLIPQSKNATFTTTTASSTSIITTISTNTTTNTKKINVILSRVKIYQKSKLTENTYHYLIEIPEKYKDLEWISPLSHVSLTKYNKQDENELTRDDESTTNTTTTTTKTITTTIVINNDNIDSAFKSYTPIKQTDDKKYLEFLIKGYENGDISKHIHQLNQGDYLLLKGPIQTNENFNFKKQQNYLLMIAGGTGITPMIQIILETLNQNKDKLNNNNNTLKFILIYSSNNENDIIYKNELDELSKQFKDRLIIHYVITKPINKNNNDNNNNIKYGRINQDLILSCLEPIIIKLLPKMITDSMETLVCGPIDFNKSINDELIKIGFKNDQIHILE